MDSPNIKIYLGISVALIVLFILVLVIPFTSKKSPSENLQPTATVPFPTSVVTNPSPGTNNQLPSPTPITVKATFTGGALDEKMPQQVIDLAAQKKDLKSKVLLNLTTFTVDFDYNTDKFVVTLYDPKDQTTKEFESWRAANYPALSTDQFLIK